MFVIHNMFMKIFFNSLWTSDTIWHFSSGSACLLPSHYLNQCWHVFKWTLRNKLLWNSNQIPFPAMPIKLLSANCWPFCPSLTDFNDIPSETNGSREVICLPYAIHQYVMLSLLQRDQHAVDSCNSQYRNTDGTTCHLSTVYRGNQGAVSI